jgi:hypothetical protein
MKRRHGVNRVLLAVCAAAAVWGWASGQAAFAESETMIPMQVSPKIVYLGSATNSMTIHADIDADRVNMQSPAKLSVSPLGDTVTATSMFADDRGDLVAKFPMTGRIDEHGEYLRGVKDILNTPTTRVYNLYMFGRLNDSSSFSTKPTPVKVNPVKDRPGK